MKNTQKNAGRTRSARQESLVEPDRDLFAEDVSGTSSPGRTVSSVRKRKKKRSMALPITILILAIILASLLGVLFLHYRDGGTATAVHSIKTEEKAQYDNYVNLINSAQKPADWDENAFNTLKDAALGTYDQSLLNTISQADSGVESAKAALASISVVSTQPEKVKQFEALFSDPSAYPANIVNLVASNPGMVDFVLAYPQHKDGQSNMDAQIPVDAVQDLKTFNPEWGYAHYGDGLFVQTGAAPTAISELFSFLLQDPSLNPLQVAQWATEYGYDVTPVSDTDSIFSGAALAWGVPMNPLPGYKTQITDALSAGDRIIAQQGDNTSPHFLVITGLDENGNWMVNDPLSANGTTATDPDSIADSITAAYAFWYE